MEFCFSAAEEQFRSEIRSFLKRELPRGWMDEGLEVEDAESKDSLSQGLARKMAERGWITATWPKEYGGLGWNQIQQVIFQEEMFLNRVPRTYITGGGPNNVGPTIALYGNEEQKARYLPGIARAEEFWCQLFSEPNAGSDLAGLQTTADEDGDDFVVNGTKIWSSGAHQAKWGALLCRTDPKAPKHRGISYLIVDMKSPGISVRPIVNICDRANFSQVFLDKVRVPKANLVGEKNRGWYTGSATLNLERSFARQSAYARQYLEQLLHFIKKSAGHEATLKRNPALRHRLANIAVELEVSRLLAYRVAWLQSRGEVPSYEASVSKLHTGETTLRLVQLAMEVLGLYGQLKEGSGRELMRGRAQEVYLAERSITIAGGTSEIQRNVIAHRGLKLGGN